MPPTIHRKCKYFHSTVQTAQDRRQKFHFCCLPFDVDGMLSLCDLSTETFLSRLARPQLILFLLSYLNFELALGYKNQLS